jgi:hypothetical protein
MKLRQRPRHNPRYKLGGVPDAMGEIFFALCKSVDTPVSLGCWLRYKYGELEQLARKKVAWSDYCNGYRFREDYLVVSYLSKYKGLNTGIDVKQVAIDGFTAAEAQCKETNERLRKSLQGHFDPVVEPLISEAVRKIGRLLGPLKLDQAFEHCRMGPGATFALRSARANLVNKLDPGKGSIDVTRRCLPWLKLLIESDPHWAAAILKREVVGPFTVLPGVFQVVRGNRLTTVPKDATKDRTIAAEPTGNIFCQLGVAQLLRHALRSVGIDLDDQSRNRKAALLGSITGRVATLDLKSASDTKCRELIKQFFPYEWFELLDQLRSPEGTWDGRNWFEYEKFSSMGNGFTFELETIVFWAIASTVVEHLGCKGRVLVYGDDVVLPSPAYDLTTTALRYCGFEVNPSKSFAIGPFRESCGGHYWDGIDVTPIYQKEAPVVGQRRYGTKKPVLVVDLPEAYRCANRIIRLAWRRGQFSWLDDTLFNTWKAARRTLLLQKPRHVVPLSVEEDDGLALPEDELSTHYGMVEHGLAMVHVLSFTPSKLEVPALYQGALLAYTFRQHRLRKPPRTVREYVRGKEFLWGDPRDFWVAFSGVSGDTPQIDSATTEPSQAEVTVRRAGRYVSRRRKYPIGTSNVAWL